ncbi:MAG: methionine adenosyltransferase [Dorea sp.]|jgi:S-adenosylmethionine synthetase|nr:methionine adenosyltransferase [Dorea sp.]
MKRFYTAESVAEGHPDKLCDLIADSILDECLKEDSSSRVACEVMATKGNLFVAGEITSRYEPDAAEIAKEVLEDAGYTTENIKITVQLHRQSPDIAGAVEHSLGKQKGMAGKETDFITGAGDQGVMIGYACDETPQMMPMPVVLANRIVRELSACRRSNYIAGILPDGKAQVTVEYENGKPLRIDTVIVSCQHTEDKNIRKLEQEIKNKVLHPALRLLPPDEETRVFINPSGRFVLGGIEADTGLTGRKLMADSYGSMVPHGGGAFSGKDCSKTDRSGAYMARYIAKNIVAARLASRCQVSLAYAIGMAEPVMVQVDTFGTGTVCADDCLAAAVPLVFGLAPGQICETLRLQRPIFRRTAVYGHFGRKEFPWERTDQVEALKNTVM